MGFHKASTSAGLIIISQIKIVVLCVLLEIFCLPGVEVT